MEKELTEQNTLIAKFMSANAVVNEHYELTINEVNWILTPKEMKYHSSWNWLMSVVEKIESLNFADTEDIDFSFDVTIGYDHCTIQDEDTTRKALHIYQYAKAGNKKEAVFNAVIKFIKWHNENKQS